MLKPGDLAKITMGSIIPVGTIVLVLTGPYQRHKGDQDRHDVLVNGTVRTFLHYVLKKVQ